MPLYDYKCPAGDVSEVFFTMQEKPEAIDCPMCGLSATSLVPAIGPSKLNSAGMRVLDATRASAETPEVVSTISGTRTGVHQPTTVTKNPLHQKLPRP